MTTFILSGGYYHKAPDGGQAFCNEITKGINSRPIKILDCLFGRSISVQQKIEDDKKFFSQFIDDVEFEVAVPEHFVDQIKNCDVLFFQGSRPEDMIKILNEISNWENALTGKIVVASSGGASMLAAYFGTGKSTSGSPRIGEGLGILPIKFIPHWKSDHGVGFTADWDGLYETLSSHGEDLEIVTLADGEFRVFHK